MCGRGGRDLHGIALHRGLGTLLLREGVLPVARDRQAS